MAAGPADPYLRASLACATTINLFNLWRGALLILFASRELGLSAGVIGLALGIGAIGGLVGTVLAGPWPGGSASAAPSPSGRGLRAPFALLPLAGRPDLARAGVVALVEFISALGVMCLDIPLNALMTAVTPDGVRSRVTRRLRHGQLRHPPPRRDRSAGWSGEWIGIGPDDGGRGGRWLAVVPLPAAVAGLLDRRPSRSSMRSRRRAALDAGRTVDMQYIACLFPRRSPRSSRALLRDDVYRRVRDAIVDGTLAPGRAAA